MNWETEDAGIGKQGFRSGEDLGIRDVCGIPGCRELGNMVALLIAK